MNWYFASRGGDSSKNNKAMESSIDNEDDVLDIHHFPDNFYTGLIVFLDRARGRGVIRSDSGREIPFQFPFVAVVNAELHGRMPGIEMLNEGDNVGFDVGWTSKGLRVTKIKPAASRISKA